MESLIQDVRYAVRMLRTSVGFTVAAVATLALAIGATTAIFTVFDAVLVRPLPYPDADRLVAISERPPSGLRNSVSPATFLDWRQRTKSFSAMSAAVISTATIVDGDRAVSVPARFVTPDYLDTLGVSTALGRALRPGDGDAGRQAIVITNYAWRSRFGSDSAIVGRTLQVDGRSPVIVGVLTENAAFDGAQIELFAPVTIVPGTARRDTHVLNVVARLARGASVASAQAELDVIAAAIGAENPETNGGWGVIVEPLASTVVSATLRQSLLVLAGAVGLILLIGCANVANLMLARSAARKKELAIRAAIGATRRRLVRQLLVESAVLAACGAAVALLIGGWLLRILTALMPQGLLPPHTTLGIGGRVVMFTACIGVGAALLVGLLPSAVGSKTDVNDALKQESRSGGASLKGRRWRHALVVSEIAMATGLLAGASLLVVSLVRLLQVDPGFDPHGVLTLRVTLPPGRYPAMADARGFYRAALDRLVAVPGAEHIAISTSLPLRGWLTGEPFEIEGTPLEKPTRPYAHFQSVSPDYFRTLGLPVLAGRSFTAGDDERSRPVAIVNQTLSERFFTEGSVIGKYLVLDTGIGNVPAPTRYEIVGVAGRVKVGSLADAETQSPEIYVPLLQVPVPAAWISVRSARDPKLLVRTVGEALAAVDRAVPLTRIGTLDEAVEGSALPARFRMRLLATLAALAVALAAVGIYGVRAYAVGERVPEIGIRMALGASPADVLRLMVREALWIVAIGTACGLALAPVVTRTMRTLLFGVGATDPLVLGGTAALMALIAIAASMLPAYRASRIDPARAIR